jgi:hypothetical protein
LTKKVRERETDNNRGQHLLTCSASSTHVHLNLIFGYDNLSKVLMSAERYLPRH